METTINQINSRLLKLSEEYKKILPKYLKIEEAYELKRARIMEQIHGQFPSQALREAAAKLILSETKEYTEYQEILPEKQILDTDIKILLQVSRNITFLKS